MAGSDVLTPTLRVIDVSNPSSPVETGIYTATLRSPADLFVADGYAYVADQEAGLRVIDARDPTAIAEVGGLAMPGSPQQLAVQGDLAFVTEVRRWQEDAWHGGGLRVISIANPAQPVEVGYLPVANVRDLAV